MMPPKKPMTANPTKSPTVTDLDNILLDNNCNKHEEDPDIMTMDDILKNNFNASYKSLFARRIIPYSGGHMPVYKLD
jgi:hypothetical protein